MYHRVAPESPTRPWIRYWARFIDTWSASLALQLVLVVAYPPSANWDPVIAPLVLLFFYCCFIEPLCFAVAGTTPGKALLAVNVRTRAGKRLSFGEALPRSLDVWLFGWALGIPLVNLCTLLYAYVTLQRKKTTLWDRAGGFVVLQGQVGYMRGTIAAIIIVGLIAVPAMILAIRSVNN